MVTHLLESGTRRHRSLSAAIPSIAFHSALILAAIHATAKAALRPTALQSRLDALVFVPDPGPRTHATAAHTPAGHGLRSRTDAALSTAPEISVALPLLSLVAPGFGNVQPIITGRDFDGGMTLGPVIAGNTNGPAGVLSSRQVDRAAEPMPGTRAPDYPEALREGGVQGVVVAQFVVDSAGRVEAASFRVVSSGHALFSAAVKSAVERARFSPAKLGGLPVRQLVQQSFSFVLR